MTPKYSVNSVVYLRESASIGHLEAVRISGVYNRGNDWIYTVYFGIANPRNPAIYGDRILQSNGNTLYYTEGEFVTECEALRIAESAALKNLQNIQSRISQICPGTE